MLEQLKGGALHNDIGASAEQRRPLPLVQLDRLDHVELADGSAARRHDRVHVRRQPGGPGERARRRARAADWSTLWRFAADTGATFFGAGAAFYASCLKAAVEPQAAGDLAHCARSAPPARRSRSSATSGSGRSCRNLAAGRSGSTRSPAGPTSPARSSPACARCRSWPARCSAAVSVPRSKRGASPTRAGAVARWSTRSASSSAAGRCRRCRSTSGATSTAHACARATSRCTRASGATATGSASRPRRRDHLRPQRRDHQPARHPHGNRRAVPRRRGAAGSRRQPRRRSRMLGRESYMPLFVVLREGLALDEALTRRLKAIRSALSARHVPNEIFQVGSIPRTLSGKKMELPVKKLLLGAPPTTCSSSTRWPTPRASPGSPTSPAVAARVDWARLQRQLREIAAAVEDQRLRAVAARARLDLADEDDVVAFFVAAAVEALEDRGGAVEQRHAARAGRKATPSKRSTSLLAKRSASVCWSAARMLIA